MKKHVQLARKGKSPWKWLSVRGLGPTKLGVTLDRARQSGRQCPPYYLINQEVRTGAAYNPCKSRDVACAAKHRRRG